MTDDTDPRWDVYDALGDAVPGTDTNAVLRRLAAATDHPTVDLFLEVVDQVRDLHLKKSRDYGTDGDPYANVRGSEGWGVPAWAGAMLRANDKVVRLQTYVRTGQLANEGVEDSLIDIAVYACIALALWREQTSLPTGRATEEEAQA